MIQVEIHKAGLILPVRANAGAKRNSITGEHNGMLKVSVTQVAEKGKANEAIEQILCHALGLKRSQIVLQSGGASSHKRFLITGIGADPEPLQKQIHQLLSS